jgi:hypothetical protein
MDKIEEEWRKATEFNGHTPIDLRKITPSDGLLWTMVQQRKEFNKINKTMKEKIYVKSESVQTFLAEKMINYSSDNGRIATNGVSYYHLMRDSILIRKDSGVEIGDTIRVELDDQTQGSYKQLTNIYIYEAKSFDDVAINLVLIDFKIELK